LTDARRAPDLAQRDWLDAGQSLLKRGGLKALKLRPLADELGVSTGSFYHHFPDFDAYQGRLAAYFADAQVNALLDAVARAEAEPLPRIRLLAATVRRRRLSRLALAMRAWGESDPRARAAVDAHDDAVLAFLTRCLTDLGFRPREARVRGFALIATGLAHVHAPDLKAGDLSGDLIRLLCEPPVPVKNAP
jgi:AcrR family transcriptional regulator